MCVVPRAVLHVPGVPEAPPATAPRRALHEEVPRESRRRQLRAGQLRRLRRTHQGKLRAADCDVFFFYFYTTC